MIGGICHSTRLPGYNGGQDTGRCCLPSGSHMLSNGPSQGSCNLHDIYCKEEWRKVAPGFKKLRPGNVELYCFKALLYHLVS